jgi:hypothetical protein
MTPRKRLLAFLVVGGLDALPLFSRFEVPSRVPTAYDRRGRFARVAGPL